MNSALDELFSPDRLRQHWQAPTPPEQEPTRAATNQAIHAKYQELLGLIAKEFSDVSRLALQFDELSEKIRQTFPLDSTSKTVDAKDQEAIVFMVEELEELLWALSLAQGSKQ